MTPETSKKHSSKQEESDNQTISVAESAIPLNKAVPLNIKTFSPVNSQAASAQIVKAGAIANSEAIEIVEIPAIVNSEVIEIIETPAIVDSEAIEIIETPAIANPKATEITEAPTIASSETIEIIETPTIANSETIEIVAPPGIADSEAIEIIATPTIANSEAIEITEAPAIFNSQTTEIAEAPTIADSEATEITEAPAIANSEAIEIVKTHAIANPEATEIIAAVKQAIGGMNRELKNYVLQYSLNEIQAAIDLFQTRSQTKQISNPSGWIVDCLRGRWWEKTNCFQNSTPAKAVSSPTPINSSPTPTNSSPTETARITEAYIDPQYMSLETHREFCKQFEKLGQEAFEKFGVQQQIYSQWMHRFPQRLKSILIRLSKTT
ncbi:MAG: hypothetical protein HC786_29265 [Richelia sp. CSU_2_1]|nr:hypothetical protein [Richelia sp. CSU_2_1]